MNSKESKQNKIGRLRFGALFLFGLILSGCATAPYRPKAQPPLGIYHTVSAGQTLYRISKTYGVEISEIMRLNNITDPNQISAGKNLFIPGAKAPLTVMPYSPETFDSIARLVGKKQTKVRWHYITLHHSATLEGNAYAFDRNHRNRHMGGLFYHFVIGNGNGSGDGEIEVGWRWIKQDEVSRRQDIQVCLVGDFNRQQMSSAQFDSLTKLLKVVMKKYSIPAYNIRIHKDVTNRPTECPGENFPLRRILAEARMSS